LQKLFTVDLYRTTNLCCLFFNTQLDRSIAKYTIRRHLYDLVSVILTYFFRSNSTLAM